MLQWNSEGASAGPLDISGSVGHAILPTIDACLWSPRGFRGSLYQFQNKPQRGHGVTREWIESHSGMRLA